MATPFTRRFPIGWEAAWTKVWISSISFIQVPSVVMMSKASLLYLKFNIKSYRIKSDLFTGFKCEFLSDSLCISILRLILQKNLEEFGWWWDIPVATTAQKFVIQGQNHRTVHTTVYRRWTERLRDRDRAGRRVWLLITQTKPTCNIICTCILSSINCCVK